MTIQFANIEWRENNGGTLPYSLDFNDVYFNNENGLAETHYVFIDQNNLTERFKTLQTTTFTIVETGFGTGLNFLAVADCWLKYAPKTAKLNYFSIEKLPLRLADMRSANQLWPQFSAISIEFLTYYKNLTFTTSIFSMAAGRIDIGLWLGDVNDVLANANNLHVDAWLLDGFAPAKNADMWSNEVFAHMARLSGNHTTFATFTSAGLVRRGLQVVGFAVKKHTGFGKKREMLSGVFTGGISVESHC